MGEIEQHLREQKVLRDLLFPDCPFVIFWFDYHVYKNGQRISRFAGFWNQTITALASTMKGDGIEGAESHFHHLRRSAHTRCGRRESMPPRL